MERFGWTFGPGDKVMQVANDYDRDVYNGDLGVVSRIDQEEAELDVAFDGREVTYGFGELDELVLAYATTIHKSQGSEYPGGDHSAHDPALHHAGAQPALYGVTRGKKLVVLVGQKRALAIAVKNQGRAGAGRSCGSGCVSALPLKGATMRALCPARPPTRDPLFTPRRRGPGRAGDRSRLD